MSGPTCEKCGSDDLLVRWHGKPPPYWETACHEAARTIHLDGPSSRKEHLHYHCRRCQFGWIGPLTPADPEASR